MAQVEWALDCNTECGESPVCDAAGNVFFVDTFGSKILWYNSVNGAHKYVSTPQKIGCIVPRAGGSLVAALEVPIVNVEVESITSETWSSNNTTLAEMPKDHRGPEFRWNDGKVDPAGRFWVGSMNGSAWSDPEALQGRLYVLESGATELVEKVPGVSVSNGLAWSADRTKLYYVDSARYSVDVFDYDLGLGAISNRRTAASFPECEEMDTTGEEKERGLPDGICLDASGKVWVAIGESGSVRQMDVETGKEVGRVELPVKRVTSCAFGGVDLSELYVTTKSQEGKAMVDLGGARGNSKGGGLFKCHIPGVKGFSYANQFGG